MIARMRSMKGYKCIGRPRGRVRSTNLYFGDGFLLRETSCPRFACFVVLGSGFATTNSTNQEAKHANRRIFLWTRKHSAQTRGRQPAVFYGGSFELRDLLPDAFLTGSALPGAGARNSKPWVELPSLLFVAAVPPNAFGS